MKTIILAGGLGTRLREETEFRPKPLVEIGGMPIIWHIMKNYHAFGFKSFLIALGYKGHLLKDFFYNYHLYNSDLIIESGSVQSNVGLDRNEDWNVVLRDTGQLTPTGGRIFALRDIVEDQTFMCTYGDGLSNIDIRELVSFHKSHNKVATLSAAIPKSRFGSLKIGEKNLVENFIEKPEGDAWVSAGFFVFDRKIFEYLNPESTLEREPFEELTKEGNLAVYRHSGFWQPMDTLRESIELNSLWASGRAPWKNWDH
jgi:glucose-1-phosphate cytidylyltransferase